MIRMPFPPDPPLVRVLSPPPPPDPVKSTPGSPCLVVPTPPAPPPPVPPDLERFQVHHLHRHHHRIDQWDLQQYSRMDTHTVELLVQSFSAINSGNGCPAPPVLPGGGTCSSTTICSALDSGPDGFPYDVQASGRSEFILCLYLSCSS